MKFFAFLLFIAACSSSQKWDQNNAVADKDSMSYEQGVQAYQDSMSYAFVSGQNKVLLPEDLKHANPLNFYPPNAKYRLTARFERILNGQEFEMPTTTDRLPVYKPFGILHFELNGDSFQLHLYQNMQFKDYLFCPFKDLTNGSETYGAGRYLDFSMADTLKPVIDFNYCYNPYCAYNHNYSCPIPPSENHLKTRIEAGVKNWKE